MPLMGENLHSLARMKSVLVLFISVFCLFAVASVQCYDGRRGYDPFVEFIRSQKSKLSEDIDLGKPVYLAASQDGLKEADKIVNLPGQPIVNFSQYSGYVTVDPDAGRALFYYFTESDNSSTNPLVLWLNGGPGCSSFGAGAMTELGPFRVNPDGKTLWLNKYAWNNLANVIFLESPAGVGFSYSNRSSDYVTGDEQTALDTYTFLVNWLERFPEYKTRDFYITGESYAGHYIPQLAALILKNNEITNQTASFINLKGIAIGNAYVDNEDMLLGRFNMMWTHSLISDEIHEGIQENCNFSLGINVSNVCKNYEIQAYDIIGNLDPYEIYAPLCSSNSTAPSISGFDPCSDDYVDAYLNTPEVQKALHANMTGISTWNLCNVNLRRNYEGQSLTVLPTIQELMASGISIWMYSGDLDLVVPVTSTKLSLTKLGAPIKTPWYAWYNQGEVGGFVVEYENLTFVTVRGSGHFVPSYQPERALSLFSSFLNGTLPPSKM